MINNKTLLLSVIAVEAVCLVILGFWLLQVSQYPSPVYNQEVSIADNQSKTLDIPLDNQTALEKENEAIGYEFTSSKLYYENPELGISFTYPAWFGGIHYEVIDGEVGQTFYGVFENVSLEFGGATKDFQQGKDGWHTDYNGSQDVSGQISKIITVPGGRVEVITGSGPFMIGSWYPEGTYGAVIKLNNPEFSGLSFLANMTNRHREHEQKITQEEFEGLLHSIVIE